jgi:hypothetical protein
MRPSRFFWLLPFGAFIVGCRSLFAPLGIPDDPLLTGRQPIESRGHPLPVPTYKEPLPPGEEIRSMPKRLPTVEELIQLQHRAD